MTADERIEKLLNRFGQTIEDLPKSADNCWSTHVYESRHLISAKKAALIFMMDEWQDADAVPEIRYEVEECLLDYICHLADVIDKLEIALDTAARMTTCGTCANEFLEECRSEEHCNYQVCDWCLRDEVTKEELEALDEDC